MSSVDPIITGCWQLSSGHHGPLDEEETQRALANHVSLGMGTLDCGDIYTGVEARIGRFTVSEHCPPGIRARLRIHTKFVPDLDRLESVDVRYVEATLRRSIRRLRLPAGQPLDLVQFHWWALGRGNLVQVAQHLGSLADPCGPAGEQLLLQVGLTNFDTATTRAILDAGVKVASTQIQFSLLDRRALHSGLLALCKERGVSVLCYGALAGGLLSERWLGAEEPEAWSSPMTAETRSLTKYFLVARDFGPWQLVQTLLSTLDAVAKHIGGGTTIAQVALAWVLQHPGVKACIVGLPRGAGIHGGPGEHRSKELVRATQLTLSAADLHAIDTVLTQANGPAGEFYELERQQDGEYGSIMRYNLSQVGCAEHAEELIAEWRQLRRETNMFTASDQVLVRQLMWETGYCLRAILDDKASSKAARDAAQELREIAQMGSSL